VLLGKVLAGVFEGQIYGMERRACAALLVQVWAEPLRDDQMARTSEDGYAGMGEAGAGLPRSRPHALPRSGR
jgi:TetR/AcrR family transcriptional regulator, transcriptional repressor of aconitase